MTSAVVAADQVTPRPQMPPGRHFRAAAAVSWIIAAALPLIGLVSLLWHAEFDPEWTNPGVHLDTVVPTALARTPASSQLSAEKYNALTDDGCCPVVVIQPSAALSR